MSSLIPTPDQRVSVAEVYAGLRAMQVCVINMDVPDKEILEVCNKENPQMVSGGWHTVIRSLEDCRKHEIDEVGAPGDCVECPGRKHVIVLCM